MNLKYGAAFWKDSVTGTAAGNNGALFPSAIRLLGDIGSSSK
ncbi:MAG: hypothetical protein QF704_01810 [Anaerolineales bacterium]|jgi:hypothetical protein|nr:hypothetical protein [Anaerolineales bacterium]MDP6769414.1 hypothetical protein [Anaerolineales bacterium]